MLAERAVSMLGLIAMVAIAWLFSTDRRRVPWRIVGWGMAIQLGLAVVLLKTPVGAPFFGGMNALSKSLITYTETGTRFVFGDHLVDTGFSIIIHVLPVIIFMGSVFAVLYHLGIMQRVVDAASTVLSRTMRTSGAESLAAVANLFLGMTESALLVKPYLERMTRSELFLLMTMGMATVAGSVMLAYDGMLGGGYAGHLATASLLSAPAGILISKVMIPETETPETFTRSETIQQTTSVNVIDAAAQGALAGMRLAAYVGALLIAFVALIAMLNASIATVGGWLGAENLSLQRLLGFALAPIAWLLGVPWEDAPQVGALLGMKTVINEFIAYGELADLMTANALSPRSAVIASYALCGFANFGSLAILLGGLGGMVPARRPEIAQLGLRSILSGSLATFMTGCVAGMLV